MMPCRLLLHCLFLTLLLTPEKINAQGMTESTWWAGIKSGIDFTTAQPTNRYSAFEYISPVSGSDKKYQSLFKGKAPVIAFTIDYAFTPSVAITIQPAFQNYSFGYSSRYSWSDTSGHTVVLTNTNKQKMHYLELPLMVKYGYQMGKFRVHVQAGGFYGRLIYSKKTVASIQQYQDSTAVITLSNSTQSFDLAKLYIGSHLGLIAGGGISYDINYFRLSLECNYRYGLNNITNVKNRYSDQQLIAGAYDVPDDIKLRNLEITLQCSTPLDYLMHMPGFSGKGNNRRR